ncbi:MAG: hypothetical protein LBM77_14300 [Spirochaetaceae bacterium]|jgi:hypothetical protein|nr:hypothetical protein [Spirochaetaceae bacterium]
MKRVIYFRNFCNLCALCLLVSAFFCACEPFSKPGNADEGSGKDGSSIIVRPYFADEDVLGKGRSIVGFNDTTIAAGQNGMRNFYQLIAINARDSNFAVCDFYEAAASKPSDTKISLKMHVDFGETYHILILGGHLAIDTVGSSITYKNETPTLLVLGYVKQTIGRGTSTISVPMFTVVPDITISNGTVVLSPVTGQTNQLTREDTWVVDWNLAGQHSDDLYPLKQAIAATGGTYNPNTTKAPLMACDIKYSGSIGGVANRTVVKNTMTSTSGSDIFLSLGPTASPATTFAIGDTGSVYFNLTYVPFGLFLSNLADPSSRIAFGDNPKWQTNAAKFSKQIADWHINNDYPRWQIRNGFNDSPQDTKTNYAGNFKNGQSASLNANGAIPVRFIPQFITITDTHLGGNTAALAKLPRPTADIASVNSLQNIGTAHYSGVVQWSSKPYDTVESLEPGEKFSPRTVYTAHITLTADQGYLFATSPLPVFDYLIGGASVSGIVVSSSTVLNGGAEVELSVSFPKTGKFETDWPEI